MAQLVSDNFTRANENPLSDGGNWGSAPGSGYINFQVLSDFLTGTATSSTEGLQLYTGTSAPNDQYSEVTVGSNATGNYCGATVRVNTSTGVGYVGYIYGAGGSSFIAKLTGSGSITVIKTGPTGLTLHTGDVIRCAVVGSTIALYQNGNIVTSVTDTTYTSGQFGIWNVESVDATSVFTLWAGGSTTPASGNGNQPLGNVIFDLDNNGFPIAELQTGTNA